MKKLGLIGSAVVALVLFGLFVWPTRYGHTTIQFGSRETLVRYERVGWDAWVLTPRGWLQISYERATAIPHPPPGFVVEKP
jgi:hypothetical protein